MRWLHGTSPHVGNEYVATNQERLVTLRLRFDLNFRFLLVAITDSHTLMPTGV